MSFMKWIRVLSVWLCLIPIAVLNGGFREYVLNNYFSQKASLVVSGIILIGLILIITKLLLCRIVILTKKECYIAGCFWMILTILFEFSSGIINEISVGELISAYNPMTGNLWVFVVIITFLAPRIFYYDSGKKHKDTNEQDSIIELYRGDLWECQLIETILKDNGINCFITNNIRNGYSPIISPAQQVQIMIKKSDLEKGVIILDDYRNNIK